MKKLRIVILSFPALLSLSSSLASARGCDSARQAAVFIGSFKAEPRSPELTVRIGSGVKNTMSAGYVAHVSSATQSCVATCYLKNVEGSGAEGELVSMDFICQNPAFEAMATPLTITWGKNEFQKKAVVRIGSGFFGAQEKNLRVKLDHLNSDAVPNRSPAILSRVLDRPAKIIAPAKKVASER